MRVTLIAWTTFQMPERALDTAFGNRVHDSWLNDGREASADVLAEMAGRLCYDSYNLPNPGTATNATYLGNIIRQRHFSVLEHATASFLIEDVSRSLLMEMRTHRLASYSARSTRYVDEADATFITPPVLRTLLELPASEQGVKPGELAQEVNALMEHSTSLYTETYEALLEKGYSPKQAREAAREVLPGGTGTEFVMTANHHAWREILQKRIAPGAAAEIQEVSREILKILTKLAPSTYQDIECP